MTSVAQEEAPEFPELVLNPLGRPRPPSRCQPEHLLANLLVTPGVPLQPLPADSHHIQVGNPTHLARGEFKSKFKESNLLITNLQLKAELSSAAWISDLPSQDVTLLLTSNALKNNHMILMDPVKIAGDNLEHERPGELVEDSIWIVVRGGRHVAQTCFTIFQVRTNTAFKVF